MAVQTNGRPAGPAEALAAIIAELQQLRQEVRELRRAEPPSPLGLTEWYTISSTDQTTAISPAEELEITAIIVQGATAGRGTLNVDSRSYPIWHAATSPPTVIILTNENRLPIRGNRITWTDPGSQWDVTLIGHPVRASMRGATTRQ